MSNGEDVLDSWEEIDEAELDKSLKQFTTENQQREVLFNSNTTVVRTHISKEDFRPMKLLHRPATSDNLGNAITNADTAATADEMSALDSMATSFKPVIMMLHNTNDEYQSANYTAPIANQTVKILRRPTQQSEAERRNGLGKPKQPIKSLQQREQEYAEARLRIMGSAKNPEDDLSNNTADKLKKPLISSNVTAAVSNSGRVTTMDMASTSNNAKQKQEADKSMPQYSINDNGGTVTPFGSNLHPSLCKTSYMPAHQSQQNYCFPTVPACADLYANRPPMTMMAMPPQQQLLTAQNYTHLNSGLYQMHQQQQQQQNRQYQKQFSLPTQPMQNPWPTIMGAGTAPHPKLLQQSQNNKVFYLKNNNNNKNQNQHNITSQNDSILRLPRGPDGTQGFQMRR